ncbi:uncharacterized protein PHA67_010102 isoform 3-T3 [Liasis olivaceus]
MRAHTHTNTHTHTRFRRRQGKCPLRQGRPRQRGAAPEPNAGGQRAPPSRRAALCGGGLARGERARREERRRRPSLGQGDGKASQDGSASAAQPRLQAGWAGPAAALARPASPHGRRLVFPLPACGNKSGGAERNKEEVPNGRAPYVPASSPPPRLPSAQPRPALAQPRLLRPARSPCWSEKAARAVLLYGPLARKGGRGGGSAERENVSLGRAQPPPLSARWAEALAFLPEKLQESGTPKTFCGVLKAISIAVLKMLPQMMPLKMASIHRIPRWCLIQTLMRSRPTDFQRIKNLLQILIHQTFAGLTYSLLQ